MSFDNLLLLFPFVIFSFVSTPKIVQETCLVKQVAYVESEEGEPLKNSDSQEKSTAGTSEGLALEIKAGKASYYGKKHNGRKTASGEPYDMDSLTAAHKSYPFGTIVKVSIDSIKSVVVRINDRMSVRSNRAIDLSFRAAKELRLLSAGCTSVKIEVLKWGNGMAKKIEQEAVLADVN
ncbi:MAG: septal ring lytic transglycosylase RlpA family protein [Ignavibacteria bacterium]